MFKINFFNTIYYLFVKYIVYAFILAFMENRFKGIVIDKAETTRELVELTFGYILYVLYYVAFLILLFCGPLYYVLKIKDGSYFLPLLMVFYIAEFFLNRFFSLSDQLSGIYNLAIGVLFLFLFFYKQVRIKFAF